MIPTGKNVAQVRAQGRPSFYITISALFLTLVLGVAGAISWQTYNGTSAIVLQQTEQLYQQAAREVSTGLTRSINAVNQTTRLLTSSDIAKAADLEQRLTILPLFASALKANPQIAGLQAGYLNGDYFIVRPLNQTYQRQQFNAPEQARFGIDSITTTPAPENKRLLERIFFDRNLQEISREPAALTDYDPRTRPWYIQAQNKQNVAISKVYLFFFIRKVGTTLSLKEQSSGTVIASDITLDNISADLGHHLPTDNSEIVLMNKRHQVLAYPDSDLIVHQEEENSFSLSSLAELGSTPLTFLTKQEKLSPGPLNFQVENTQWHGTILPISIAHGEQVLLLMVSPESELLSDVNTIRRRSCFLTLAIILATIPLALLIAAVLSKKLKALAHEASLINDFEFKSPVQTNSSISEIHELAEAMGMMKSTISKFLRLIKHLAGEQNFDAMLRLISKETAEISQADGSTILLLNDKKDQFIPRSCYLHSEGYIDRNTLPALPITSDHIFVEASRQTEPTIVTISAQEPKGLASLLTLLNGDQTTILILPLNNRQGESIGLLVLYYNNIAKDDERLNSQHLNFLQNFAGFAAVSLESRNLLQMQKNLLESFIQLMAGAVDAKSPYTGGHCQRVPVITKMLAEAACDSNRGTFKTFTLNDEQWEELHIAAWLHDCGKVTTPEYVVDKSTKLETIYDRIHEIRMRFEVLKRDAHIHFYEQLLAGGNKNTLDKKLKKEWQQLDDDFVFIAVCNEGGEFMASEQIERLQQLAKRTWVRTLDDRIGISWEEKQRKERTTAVSLPHAEPLLGDKAEHLILRGKKDRIDADNPWGFKLDVPEYLYNRGELYNLQIPKGTLTTEEHFKIKDHIVQTIIMLEHLPFPSHLRRVPEIAGGHHETMIGTGYPKKLHGNEMSITARMMVIADIFEALTASDRPYKKAKTLSESIRILDFMCKDHHIDPELFKLFLTSGIYLTYAEQYLDPEQIDPVTIEEYL